MYSWAKPGIKCVCVDAKERSPLVPNMTLVGGMDGLEEGKTYTVREVFVDPVEGNVSVRLCEIWRPPHPRQTVDYESGFYADRFRPLITKTQSEDIEMFLRIASKAPSNMESTDA